MRVADVAFIRETIFNLVSFQYEGNITVAEGDHLVINGNWDSAHIVYSDKAELARGFFLLAKELSGGAEQVLIEQKRHFKTLGVMPSLPTNPLTMENLKQYINCMAAVGMNSLLLYIEDCYELEGYPYFGYLCGRYSRDELKEMDAYAEKLGIEVIPCLQTLAHLTTYMRWGEAGPVKETAHSMMVGEEATYTLIETMLKTMKECFHTNKIHLGMDEARELGLGKYLFEHEYQPKSVLFAEHVNRVKELCKKYDLEPQIWSDMIYKSCGGWDDEYSKRAVITNAVREAVQGVSLMYWDYYQDNKEKYIDTITRHRQIHGDVLFAGGIWNWDGYLPNFDYTMKTMKPAMEACLDTNIDTVYATVWDDPRDTFLHHSIYDFAIFSEYCYLGHDCTEDDIHSVGEFLTGYKREMLTTISEFFLGYDGATSMGARFIHCDAFYELMRYTIDYKEAADRYFAAAEEMKQYAGEELADYARQAMLAAGEKAKLLELIRPAYQNRDMKALQEICHENLPACIEAVSAVGDWQEKLWHKYQKPFAIDGIQMRFAGIVKRLCYQKERLEAFLRGEALTIPELEETALNDENATWLSWENNAFARKK
ncbi:MAG: family 20 glycosylhydrolase [Clostridia bacterium]|nr:family 20 glycosylhydrolase [Clostridia bacterium]